MINESEIYENGSKLVNIFKSGFDKTLDRFLSDNNSTGYVREPCIQASVYTQEPNCPPNFPPNNENLTPLQWLAIFGMSGEDGEQGAIETEYMLDIVQDYGADGTGKGDYKDCFFEAPFEINKMLDYSPVELACIFNNSGFLSLVNLSCDNDSSLFYTGYQPLIVKTKKFYQGDVRQFMPLQIAAFLGSEKVTNFLLRDLSVSPNQIPNYQTLHISKGSKWRKFNSLTLGIVGFSLPLEDWDPVSRAVRSTKTRKEYTETINELLDTEESDIPERNVNPTALHPNTSDSDPSKWSALYELIHNAFGKEYTKGSEQDLFNMYVLESFLPDKYVIKNIDFESGTTITTDDKLPWNISADQVLQGLNESSNLSTRKKDNPSPISEYEKIRRRMFIYDTLIKSRKFLRPKIEEISLKKLIMKNVENTFPDMMEYLLATDKYMNRTSIAKDRLKREQKTVDRIKGSEEIGSDARELIKKFISLKGGKKKSRKSKKNKKGKVKEKKRKLTKKKSN